MVEVLVKRNSWLNVIKGLVGIIAGLALTGTTIAQVGSPGSKDISSQSITPMGGGGPDSPLGTTFSYQGLLKINGVPYTGNCDVQFGLWNGFPGSGGILITTVAALPAVTSVTNGLFTTYVDFGNQFTGDYRNIEPQVRCPTGSGTYQSLGNQVIYPTPYALGLRAGATITGTAATALTAISAAPQGTGLYGEADNGTNAWGVAGYSGSGIGVLAASDDNAGTPHTALKIAGGKLSVGGAVTPAFVLYVSVVSGGCSSMSSPLFNADPNAMIFVTPRQTTPTVPAHDVRVLYNTGIWYLCSPSLAPGMTYNVLVINQ